MTTRKELIKNYESWEAVLDDYYTCSAEMMVVHSQWRKLVDNEIARYLFIRKEAICNSQISCIINEEIEESAPYIIRGAKYGYSFKLTAREFITHMPRTIEVLLHNLGDHELLPKMYTHNKDVPWNYNRIKYISNLSDDEFFAKVKEMLGIEDIEVYLPHTRFS